MPVLSPVYQQLYLYGLNQFLIETISLPQHFTKPIPTFQWTVLLATQTSTDGLILIQALHSVAPVSQACINLQAGGTSVSSTQWTTWGSSSLSAGVMVTTSSSSTARQAPSKVAQHLSRPQNHG